MSEPSPSTILRREEGRPLYVQLHERLRSNIQQGTWPAGTRIPSEAELMASFRVSRITARAALDQLVRDGLIERMRGKGSFVRAMEPETRACLISFTEEVSRSGRTPTTDVLGVEVRAAEAFVEDELPFAPSELIARIERVRRIDGRRVALMRSFIPERVVPGISSDDFDEVGAAQSLLYVLEHRFGVVLDEGEETLIPQLAVARDAGPLGIDVGDPVAVKVCRISDTAGRTTLYEAAIWCAPQTQPVHRLPARYPLHGS